MREDVGTSGPLDARTAIMNAHREEQGVSLTAPGRQPDSPVRLQDISLTAPVPSGRTGSATSSEGCVEVNVGGTTFKASAATLRKSPFFASLLSDELTDDLRDQDGRLFVDRDPELFAEVLRIMRGYRFQVSSERLPWNAVRAEADFYQIPLDLLHSPAEVVIPPDILSVRRIYTELQCTETLRRDEICMYSLSDLPPDLKTQTRIVAVEVNRHQCGTKTVFVISQQVLEEAGFCERSETTWERTERRCYHKYNGMELVIPKHPMEVGREEHPEYVCVVYAVPPVGPVIVAGNSVVGVQGGFTATMGRRLS